MTTMKSQQRIQVNVGNAITIGQHAGLVANKRLHALDSSTGHRSITGINQGHFPVNRVNLVRFHITRGKINSKVGIERTVIKKILLDNLGLVTQGHIKILVAKV